MRKHFDFWSVVVIALTLLLFVMALLIKGLTHDLLLEAGVFLVSVKLILMGHKNSVLAIETEKRLDQIYDLLRRQDGPQSSGPAVNLFAPPAAPDVEMRATTGRHR